MLPSPDILNEYALGKFVLANLAAKRAKQLREGAIPLVQVESRHPLTIALAEIAAGKIDPRMLATVANPLGENLDNVVLDGDVVPGEFGMLLPALDENEVVLIETIGLEDSIDGAHDDEGDGEISLADLGDADEAEEVEKVADADEDTISLSDIADEEAAGEDDSNDSEV